MSERSSGKHHWKDLQTIATLFSTYLRLQRDTRLSSQEFLNTYGNSIRSGFPKSIKEGATPVLICAWNEANELPRLLRALSFSDVPVKPIVVDNNSTDGTGDIARDLGAHVIFEHEQGLMPALITGFRSLVHDENVQEFLLTDADSYPLPTWASSMNEISVGSVSGGMVGGPVIYHGGFMRDTARNISVMLGDIMYHASGKVMVRGANGLIKFGTNGAIAHCLANDLEPKIGINTDKYVRDSVRSAGGEVVGNLALGASVFSSGDRYPSLVSLFKAPPYGNSQDDLYSDWKENNPHGEIYKSPYDLW